LSSKPHEPDLKNIWQNQEMEKSVMSVEEVRLNARKYMRRNQRDLIASSVFAIVTAVWCGTFLMNARMNSLRLVAGLVVAVLVTSTVWRLLRVYRGSRGKWSSVIAGSEPAMTSCLEFYRGELERQRESARYPSAYLVIVFVVLVWLMRQALMQNRPDLYRMVLPYILILAMGMIVLMVLRKVQSRRVHNDLAALDDFEKEMVLGGRHDTSADEHEK
jgi:hypothetical protein